MKKVLSILLMGSMLGAPIVSSNCSAYTINGKQSSDVVSLAEKIHEDEDSRTYLYTAWKNGLPATSSNRYFHILGLLKTEFNIGDIKNTELEDLKTKFMDLLTDKEKNSMDENENIINEACKFDESISYVSEESSVEENDTSDDEYTIEENKDIETKDGKKLENAKVVVDVEQTKQKKSPMFKIIVGGVVIAVVTYAGLVAYDMYCNGTSFKDANSNLLNIICNWANRCYECSSEYAKKFAESVKNYANDAYNYITSNSTEAQLNQTISNPNDVQLNQNVVDQSAQEDDYFDLNDGVMENTPSEVSEKGTSTATKVGIGATITGAAATAGKFVATHGGIPGLVMAGVATLFYYGMQAYAAYQM